MTAGPVPSRFLACGAVLSTTLVLLLPAPVEAQQPTEAQGGPDPAPPSPTAPVAEGELTALRLAPDLGIDLDGRLDEEVWGRASAITDFTQQEPVEGASPSRGMEIRVVYDEERLYIGAMVYDDPSGILAHQRERDAGLGTDDRFMWILDTFLDGRTGYFFEINPAGLMGDGLLTGGGRIQKSWDGIWEARTYLLADGWSAEIEIPFRTLNFDPALTTWGINFQRTIRRNNEEILWRGWRRDEGLFRAVHAGRLSGLGGMSQGLGLEAVPSVIGSWRNLPGLAEESTFPRDLSLDLNYSVTESLRASVSVNTDFAEVESDQRRVNLTRFPLFFPERRDFFLEGSAVFDFAPRSGPRPFFSRRIGLQQGVQIPIDLGARMTGQAGPYDLGFYQIRTGSTRIEGEFGPETARLVPREDFTVARVRRQILEQSHVGVIYTRRATDDGPGGVRPEDRHTVGADMQLSTRSFFGDHNAELNLFAVWNSNPDPASPRNLSNLTGRGLRLNFPNDIWSGHISYREFGEYYRPAVGFVNRNDFRRVEPRIGWSPRPESIPWIRQFDFSVQFRNLKEMGTGRLEEREWLFSVLGIRFESGDGMGVNVVRSFEGLDRPFEISEGIVIDPAGYTAWRGNLRGQTAGRRAVSASGELELGEFWNGTITGLRGRVTLRPRPGMALAMDFEHNEVDLPQGDFATDVYQLETDWSPSPWIGATTQIQYDDVTELLGLFARIRWIVTPGSEIFFVYTHNWRNALVAWLDRHELTTLSRGATIKANYTYRF